MIFILIKKNIGTIYNFTNKFKIYTKNKIDRNSGYYLFIVTSNGNYLTRCFRGTARAAYQRQEAPPDDGLLNQGAR